MLTTLTDQVLGEISHMWYIDGFDVLEGPRAEPSPLLSQLPDKLKERGGPLHRPGSVLRQLPRLQNGAQ
ncbi:MAG: hypothetical protein ACLRIS_16230 [Flavonifractor plautii]